MQVVCCPDNKHARWQSTTNNPTMSLHNLFILLPCKASVRLFFLAHETEIPWILSLRRLDQFFKTKTTLMCIGLFKGIISYPQRLLLIHQEKTSCRYIPVSGSKTPQWFVGFPGWRCTGLHYRLRYSRHVPNMDKLFKERVFRISTFFSSR